MADNSGVNVDVTAVGKRAGGAAGVSDSCGVDVDVTAVGEAETWWWCCCHQ